MAGKLGLISRLVVGIAIVCVLAIFLAPQFDLPESGLRAKQAAESLFWALAAAAAFFAGGWSLLAGIGAAESIGEPPRQEAFAQFRQLSCALLC